VRFVLVDFGKRHRHTDKRAALHRSRPPADQSVKKVSRRGSHQTRPTCYGHPHEDVTRILQGKQSRIKFKLVYQLANMPHRYVNSRAIWIHTVLPATRQRWQLPQLPRPIKTGTRFSDPRRMQGWVDLDGMGQFFTTQSNLHCVSKKTTMTFYAITSMHINRFW